MLVEIRCDNLLTPSNGGMSCSSGRVEVGYEGDTCSFTCNTGYELTGSDTRTCQNSGSWSGSESTCNMPIYLMVSITQVKTAKLYKRLRPSKILGEKRCEVKGGDHEMATMMWMIINFNNGFLHY